MKRSHGEIMEVIYELWDKEDVQGSIKSIAKELGMSTGAVRGHCRDAGLYDKRKYASPKSYYRDREPLPECIRYGRCPKCGRKLAIERVPWSNNWDVLCITCSRFPLPEGVEYGVETT